MQILVIKRTCEEVDEETKIILYFFICTNFEKINIC